ncbi:MAG: NAD(P)-dependent glycerol-3-phosphate dehydrogenase [Actinomycetota bacterium]|jgi:glycerol-3-phosphate dehydrogenase (NAD(P)+)|nr:NAD(P)-dependent glycerol-3-phosphate dehydrogenase [Actinomycetota bacterium]
MTTATAVVGAGSWGTTVASILARKTPTRLWARSPELAQAITSTHENPRYLPGVVLPSALAATPSLAEAVDGARIVLVAVPSHGFRAVLVEMAPFLRSDAVIVSMAKGIEQESNLRMSEIVAQVLPGHLAGALSGPNLAQEVAAGQPAATVVVLPDEEVAREVQERLHCSSFRVYTATDVVGCEIAGATKNVMAIAAGISDGLGFGENTRAVIITRGLAELGRLGITLGGQTLTFGGLAGVGDLVATCTSPRSRNRTVGFELGRGLELEDILSHMSMVAEGVKSAGPLVALAARAGVEMPIAEQVAAIVAGATSPRRALAALMDRPARSEWDIVLLRGLTQ